MIDDPRGAFTCRHQHLQFWPIMARFVDYYSPFWAPGAISMIDDPRGAFTWRSSTLAFLADYGPFHGLLLTVFGSRSDFHDLRFLRCVYWSVISTPHFG